MDTATFKGIFPEFSTYSSGPIEFFITVAQGLVNEDRWGDTYEYGLALFVAHHIAYGENDKQTAAAGGIPGQVRGVTTSEAVDKVSVSSDGSLVTYDSAGFWNGTSYGVRFFQLARLMGAGGVQM